MPNWCSNRVSVYSENKKDIQEIKEIFASDCPFNKLVPSPDWDTTPNDDGELPVLTNIGTEKSPFMVSKFPNGTSDDRWYDWNVEHWGVKWDIDSDNVSIEYSNEKSITLHFSTAWKPPEGIYFAMRKKYPEASISWFYDEPGMQFAGYL